MKYRLFGGVIIRRAMLLIVLALFAFTLLIGLLPAPQALAAAGDANDPNAVWLNRGNIRYRGATYRLSDKVIRNHEVFVVTEDWCTLSGGDPANKADGGYLEVLNNQSVQYIPPASQNCQLPIGPYIVVAVQNVQARHVWFYRNGETGQKIYLYNNPGITFTLTNISPRSPYAGGRVYTRDGVDQGNTCPETILQKDNKWYLFPMATLDEINTNYPNSPSREVLSEDYSNVMTNGETTNCRVAPEKVVLQYRIGQPLEFPANSSPDGHNYDGHNIGGFCGPILSKGPLPEYVNEILGGFGANDLYVHDVVTTCTQQGNLDSIRTPQRNKFHQITTAGNLDLSRDFHWDQHGIYEYAVLDSIPDLTILGDDNGYVIAQGISSTVPDNLTNVGASDDSSGGGTVQPCVQNGGALGWMICPMNDLMQTITGWIDTQITTLLKVNACRIFHTTGTTMSGCSDSANEEASSDAFYSAWKVFRAMAYALLVILGLIMVISQIAGIELFDAYTVRKMLPKIVLATIFIPLLWPLLKLVTVMANNSADALSDLIKAPFMFLQHDPTIGDWITGAGIGVGVVLGAIVFASLASVGIGLAVLGGLAIALLQALFVITVRDMAFFLLVILSPIAVALSVFEPFKKGFALWRRYLTGILFSIPAVAAVLAISKVAAALARVAHPEVGVFFALVFIAVGYMLFWPILKSTDKIAGQVDGLADKATGWAQKSLANVRNKGLQQNWHKATQERRFSGNNRYTRGFNRAASLFASMGDGNILTRAGRDRIGRAARGRVRQGQEEAKKEDAWQQYAQQDELHTAAQMSMDRGRWQTYLRDKKHFDEGGRYYHLRNASAEEKEAAIQRDLNMSRKDIQRSYLMESARYSRTVRTAVGADGVRRVVRDANGQASFIDEAAGDKLLRDDLAVVDRAQRETGAGFLESTVDAKSATGSGYGGEQGRVEMLEDIKYATGGDAQARMELTVKAKGNAGQAGRPDQSTRLGAYVETGANYDEAIEPAQAELDVALREAATARQSGNPATITAAEARVAAAEAGIARVRRAADSSIASAAMSQKSMAELMRGRPEAAAAILREARTQVADSAARLRDAIASGDAGRIEGARRTWIQATANHENALDTASYASPEIARAHADDLHNESIILADAGGDSLLRQLADAPQYLPSRIRSQVQEYQSAGRFATLTPQEQVDAAHDWALYEQERQQWQQQWDQASQAQRDQMAPLRQAPPQPPRLVPVDPRNPNGPQRYATPADIPITITDRELQQTFAGRSAAGLDGDAYGQMRRNYGSSYAAEEQRRQALGLGGP